MGLQESRDPGRTILKDEVITVGDDVLNGVVGVDGVAVNRRDLNEGVVLVQEALSAETDGGLSEQQGDFASLSSHGEDDAIILEAKLHVLKRLVGHVDKRQAQW